MGNGDSDVGTKTATRKPKQAICGAMQQQCGDGSRGHQSAPQKFVRLVGYRAPNSEPRPVPVKS